MKEFLSHFTFHTLPFTREISVKQHLSLPFFADAEKALLTVINQRMSAALVAPAGTGKTSLMRRLRSKLPEARYKVNYIKVTKLSKRDMCREICTTIGAVPASSFPMLVRRIQELFLNTSDVDSLRPVLIIDEAHDLKIDVMGMLRILTNFEMDSKLVVSIILVGQPKLLNLLNHPDLRDISKRLAHCAKLRLLSKKEIQDYIQHRCEITGVQPIPFDNDALAAIYEIAKGNIRATDRLALKTLEVVHQKNCKVADSADVVKAREFLWPAK